MSRNRDRNALSTAFHARPISPTITTLVADDGSARIDVVRRLASSSAGQRDVADAVHALCAVHGGYPGLIDLAAGHATDEPGLGWFGAASEAFALERGILATLTAAVGPLPSTPGQAQAEAAMAGQRHALDMLARSDRTGCAAGAAIALVLDWRAIRPILEATARRCGVEIAPTILPKLYVPAADGPAVERARLFGAQQLLAQHRGLWDLLDARASARGAS